MSNTKKAIVTGFTLLEIKAWYSPNFSLSQDNNIISNLLNFIEYPIPKDQIPILHSKQIDLILKLIILSL